jgi:carbamoyl-phosphate synthase large subunit
VVTKVPRFAFEKFPEADSRLTTQMKSVGEVMAIGRTFQESLAKGLAGPRSRRRRLRRASVDREEIEMALSEARPERIWYLPTPSASA